jgi:hypothetical protein
MMGRIGGATEAGKSVGPAHLVEYVRIAIRYLGNDDPGSLDMVKNLLDNRSAVLNLVRPLTLKPSVIASATYAGVASEIRCVGPGV